VAGHTDAAVNRNGLLDQRAGPIAVSRALAVEQHPGVPPAGFCALDFEGQFFGLPQRCVEVLLGQLPLTAGGGTDGGDPLQEIRVPPVEDGTGRGDAFPDERVVPGGAVAFADDGERFNRRALAWRRPSSTSASNRATSRSAESTLAI